VNENQDYMEKTDYHPEAITHESKHETLSWTMDAEKDMPAES